LWESVPWRRAANGKFLAILLFIIWIVMDPCERMTFLQTTFSIVVTGVTTVGYWALKTLMVVFLAVLWPLIHAPWQTAMVATGIYYSWHRPSLADVKAIVRNAFAHMAAIARNIGDVANYYREQVAPMARNAFAHVASIARNPFARMAAIARNVGDVVANYYREQVAPMGRNAFARGATITRNVMEYVAELKRKRVRRAEAAAPPAPPVVQGTGTEASQVRLQAEWSAAANAGADDAAAPADAGADDAAAPADAGADDAAAAAPPAEETGRADGRAPVAQTSDAEPFHAATERVQSELGDAVARLHAGKPVQLHQTPVTSAASPATVQSAAAEQEASEQEASEESAAEESAAEEESGNKRKREKSGSTQRRVSQRTRKAQA